MLSNVLRLVTLTTYSVTEAPLERGISQVIPSESSDRDSTSTIAGELGRIPGIKISNPNEILARYILTHFFIVGTSGTNYSQQIS